LLASAGFAVLLLITGLWPSLRKRLRKAQLPKARVAVTVDGESAPEFSTRTYRKILVPLDHSESDHEALGNALALARMHGAQLVLLHVEEGIPSQLFGSLSSTAEIAEGQDYLANLVASLRNKGVNVETLVRHGKSPAREIAAAVRHVQPDLVVMASHGHRGLKDLIFGTTINSLRHRVKVPLLIVNTPDHP